MVGCRIEKLLSSVAITTMMARAVVAQTADLPDNLARLGAFQTTGVTDFTYIEQTGDYADGGRANLENITLPDGFKIELYAIVPDARHIAVGPQGVVSFVGTRKSEVWAVTDRNTDRVADEVKNFAPSLTEVVAGFRTSS
jgi:hypothetical protein